MAENCSVPVVARLFETKERAMLVDVCVTVTLTLLVVESWAGSVIVT